MGGEARAETALRWAAHYLLILGFAALAFIPLTLLRGQPQRFEFSSILLLGLGAALLLRKPWGWRLAVLLCLVGLLASAAALLSSIAGIRGAPDVLRARRPAPDLAALGFAYALLFELPVLVLLLRPGVRALFAAGSERKWIEGCSRRMAAVYLLGIAVVLSAEVSLGRMIREEFVNSGLSTLARADGRLYASVWIRVSDGAAPPRMAIEKWIVYEKAVMGGDGPHGEPGVSVGGRFFPYPQARSWIFFPPERSRQGEHNIVLMGEDGRVIQVPRRITPAAEPAVMAAISGFGDLADLERRILGALPPE